MIKEKTLTGSRYKFKHINIEVLERDGENVCAFAASFVRVGINGKMSDGLMEVNQTLWDPQSTKRPKGFLILRTVEKENGTSTTIMVSEKWFIQTLTREEQNDFEKRLDKEIGPKSN